MLSKQEISHFLFWVNWTGFALHNQITFNVTSQPLTPLWWLFKCFHYILCERCGKGVFYFFLSSKACVCQGIDRNESRAPVIYRTIAQLINLMNHIIHPIIHETRSTIDHWRSISCSWEGQECLKVRRSLVNKTRTVR